jgi:cysteine desulfurase
VFQPIEDIATAAKKKNILFHCDGVQMAGKTPLRVNEWGADLFSLSGHKFGAPKGVGVLYIRKGTRLKSLILGGRQEKNRRGGTENVAGIVGMGKAAQLEIQEIASDVPRLRTLRDQLENGLLKNLTHCFVNGDKTNRTGNTTNICFEYTDSSEMIMALDLKGLACSSGSACQAGSADPSHVLLAMGLPQHQAHASLRFSLGHRTTAADIESAIAIITDTVYQLRKRNPLWVNK